MVQGQVFLKAGWYFSFLFNFSIFIFFFLLLFLSASYHNFMKKKIIISYLKMNLKIPHKLIEPDIFVKGLKNQKLIFDGKRQLNW